MSIVYYVTMFDGDEYITLHECYDAAEALKVRDEKLAEFDGFAVWVAVDYEGAEVLQ